MPLRLDSRDPGFAAAFDILVDARREADEDVSRVVSDIRADIRARGDAALAELTQRFDGHDLDVTGWQVPRQERQAALANLPAELRSALEFAADRIRAYHAAQTPADSETTDAAGVRMGARWRAVDAAGLYVPGGRAAYPSSVLMNAIPAKVAGVGRLAMVTPTPKGETNPLVLAAAEIAGVDEVWRVGGAQAIAALAYGTGRIASSTASIRPASGVSRIAWASSSCSACEKRSSATHSGFALASAITRISETPATMSMPTAPNTRRFAAATYALPGPQILSTAGIVAVP